MTPERLQRGQVWPLAERQHGVVTRGQLRELGFGDEAVRHRIARGRLHPVRRGVYAVGRPQLGLRGHWMAAVLSCGPKAVLSHDSAAAHLEILPVTAGPIHVSIPARIARRQEGILVHRRATLGPADLGFLQGIPVTTPLCTLVDIATGLDQDQLEAAINAADKLDLTDPERLRAALDELPRRPGIGRLRETLDRRTFRLTDSGLERRFLRLLRAAGFPAPETGRWLSGFRVDFFWPDLGLVVETDGLRYHRTPAQQAQDRLRDQAHTAAGLTPLRFTRAQVRFDPEHVRGTLEAVIDRLRVKPDSTWNSPR